MATPMMELGLLSILHIPDWICTNIQSIRRKDYFMIIDLMKYHRVQRQECIMFDSTFSNVICCKIFTNKDFSIVPHTYLVVSLTRKTSNHIGVVICNPYWWSGKWRHLSSVVLITLFSNAMMPSIDDRWIVRYENLSWKSINDGYAC